jgi:Antimicrobial peptide resistance and lipid A acylation protein PagP
MKSVARLLAPVCAALIAADGLAQEELDQRSVQLWLNPGSFSYHFDRDKDLRGKNTGVGAELVLAEDHVLAAGTFINSDRKRSHYGAYVWRPLHWQFTDVKVHVGAAIGGFDGYPNYHQGGWFPAALPMIAIEGERIGVNVFFVPTIANRTNGAISFQFKLRAW